MQALQPLSLTHAIGLAKIQEEKYSDIHRFQRFNNLSTTVIAPSTSTSDSTSLQPVIPKPQQHIPVKKLTPAKLQNRRDKGLCYNCNEIFLLGHKYKARFFLLISTEEETGTLSHSLITRKCATLHCLIYRLHSHSGYSQ